MFLSRLLGNAIGVGVLALITCSIVSAQSERGTITGAVRDASGAAIPAAKVVITNDATGVRLDTETNATGEFTVPSVQPGVYTVRVDKTGFRPAEEKGLTVDAATTVRADATLQVGSSKEAIEVQATAVQLQTEDAKNSVTLQNKLVDDLPLVVSGTMRKTSAETTDSVSAADR
jgi:hypothetical protein